jgi:HD-like signal output (HDOD) protein
VAKLLANECPGLNAERLFLVGLLHDIGSLAIYQKIPELAGQVLKAIGRDRRMLDTVEQNVLGFTHAQVGRELLSSWGLPSSLYEVVAFYRHPELAINHKLDVLVLNLASRLVDDRVYARPVEHTVLEFSDHTLDVLRLERIQIVAVMEQADNEYLQIFEQLLPSKQASQGIVRPN